MAKQDKMRNMADKSPKAKMGKKEGKNHGMFASHMELHGGFPKKAIKEQKRYEKNNPPKFSSGSEIERNKPRR